MKTRRQEDFERETGRFKRGLVQTGVFILLGGIAYWLTNWLFTNEYITYEQIYNAGIPGEVPEIALFIGSAFILLVGFEMIHFFFYVWIRPSGRRRANTAYVSEKDQNQYQEWG